MVCFGLPPASNASAATKHPLDKSESRKLVLENDLKVLLIRDPKFNKSAASLVVGAGSLSDHGTRQGMAHFLEHMLFMGTEKFPGVDEYQKYIADNGGWRNAYTSRDHTNYYFDVNHDALEGALDRFSQFFVAPLFTEEYTEREMNAVHSEFQKNLENDSCGFRYFGKTIRETTLTSAVLRPWVIRSGRIYSPSTGRTTVPIGWVLSFWAKPNWIHLSNGQGRIFTESRTKGRAGCSTLRISFLRKRLSDWFRWSRSKTCGPSS
jgi:hypothetical protein